MTTIYVSNDGKQFNDRHDCLEYEASQRCEEGRKIIIGRDEDGVLLDYASEDFMAEAMFITCKTPRALEILRERAHKEDYSLAGITAPGTYYWVDYMYEWISAKDRISMLQNDIAACQSALNDF